MKSLLTVILLFGFWNSQAQNSFGTLSGIIYDTNGLPMPYASILVKKEKLGVLSDSEGNYILPKVPPGKHLIEVNFIGYEASSKLIEVKKGSRLKVDFALAESVESLSEVIVKGKTEETKTETKGFAVNVIKTEEASLRNIQTNELLNTTVGVKIRQNGGLGSDVKYSLNGLSGSSVRIFLDGIPISVYGSSFNLNSIPPSMIKNIEVYKGVVPGHLAADALGGAINIVLHKSARSNFNAAVSYGSFNTVQSSMNGLYRFKNSGLTVKASGFHNSSDNDYEVSGRSVVVAGLGGVQTPITAKRFNDAYKSSGGMLQVGYTNVKWADQFFIGLTGSQDYKEVQHGAFMTIIPYKGRFLESNVLLANLTYQKKDFLVKGLTANLNGAFGKRNRLVSDTSALAYGWNGERAIDFRGNVYEYSWGSQQEGGATLTTINRNVASIRTGFSYDINEHHKFLLNHVYSGIEREDSDELRSVLENTFSATRDLYKNIYAISYELTALDEKLKASVFGKHYHQKTVSIDAAIQTDTDGLNTVVDEVVSSDKHYDGYGFALSYALLPNITLLSSAEKAIRLPNETEVFGNDGDNVVANASIRPELSNNYNLGFRFGKFRYGKNNLVVSTNLFTRNIKDRIGLPIETSFNIDDELIIYVNQGDGNSKGIEGQLNYTYNNNFGLNFNVSRFELKLGNNGIEIDVPNTPFFTMNGSLRYAFKDLFQKNARLNLFYSIYYTDAFSYLPAQGENTVGGDFFKVPEQIAQDLGLSYSFPKEKLVASFDIKNIFDKAVYDNLSVQKPGRAFYLKLNYSINKY